MQADFSRPILAIDTSTSFLSLALNKNDQQWHFHQEVGSKQSEYILPQIAHLLTQSNTHIADLGAIIYAQGAGAFTGLRIGLGIAQGLATPFDIPLIGVPCQDAVASLAPNHVCVLAATDARMGEVFFAFFDTHTQTRLSDYGVAKWQDISIPTSFHPSQIYGIGNAFALVQSQEYFAGVNQMPTAQNYLNLAQSGRYLATHSQDAELLYVRNKIALTLTEQRAQKHL